MAALFGDWVGWGLGPPRQEERSLCNSDPSSPTCGGRDSPGPQESSSPLISHFCSPHVCGPEVGLSCWWAWQMLASSLSSPTFLQVCRWQAFPKSTTSKVLFLRDKWGERGEGGSGCPCFSYQMPVSHSLLLTSLCNFIQFFYHYLNKHLPIIYQKAITGVIIFLKIKMTFLSFSLSFVKLMLVHYFTLALFGH